MATKTIKAWAVWNTELNTPCVEVDAQHEVVGAVIFTDDMYQAKQRALNWMRETFGDKLPAAKKDLGIRLKRITITV